MFGVFSIEDNNVESPKLYRTFEEALDSATTLCGKVFAGRGIDEEEFEEELDENWIFRDDSVENLSVNIVQFS